MNDPTDDATNRTARTTRRRFLRATAVAGGVAGLGGVTAGQDATEIRLGGEIPGWVGQAPASIEGQTNPTLELSAGQPYRVTWENLDGAPHNFAVLDGDGNALVRSEIMNQQGETQSVEFTASAEMERYRCEVHPTTMAGEVSVGEEAATTTPAGEPRAIPVGPEVGVELVASDPLVQPVTFAIADDGMDRRFIVDQTGRIYVHGPDGIDPEPFLDVSDRLELLTEAGGGFDRPEGFDERGLLGLAFHPEFRENRRFFVRYSAPLELGDEFAGPPTGEGVPENFDHRFVLAEFQATESLDSAMPESERRILEIPEPQFNHNAGDIAFGPDGYLYVTVGDGGGANDTGIGHVDDWYDENEGGNGQDLRQNLLGSILRIDVDSSSDGREYGVPEDNPLTDTGLADEHWAWGFRNPWRFSFDGDRLFVADVGQNLFEEVNLVEQGGNYGWNVKEGTHCFSPATPNEPPAECPDRAPDESPYDGQPLEDPIIEYPHTFKGTAVGLSVTGGHVYRGSALPDLQGRYVFGDWSRSFVEPRGRLFVATEPGAGEPGTATATETTDAATVTETTEAAQADEGLWSVEELVVAGSPNGELNRFVLAFGRGSDDELYVLTSDTGTVEPGSGFVYRLVPPGEGEGVEPPAAATTTTAAVADNETGTGAETTTVAGNATEETTTDENATAGNDSGS
ncbi:PQQ-dependent sugar dehydrogenase [Halobacteriaceae archaeon GCM10025711]